MFDNWPAVLSNLLRIIFLSSIYLFNMQRPHLMNSHSPKVMYSALNFILFLIFTSLKFFIYLTALSILTVMTGFCQKLHHLLRWVNIHLSFFLLLKYFASLIVLWLLRVLLRWLIWVHRGLFFHRIISLVNHCWLLRFHRSLTDVIWSCKTTVPS